MSCKECMAEHFKIFDGHANSLTCPNEGCQTQAHPNHVWKNDCKLFVLNSYLYCIMDFTKDDKSIIPNNDNDNDNEFFI